VINPQALLGLNFFPQTENDRWQVQWEISPQLPYFEGHFPGFPILPAFATLDVTLEAVRLLDPNAALKKLHSAKFRKPIAPSQTVLILLQKQASPKPGHSIWKVQWKSQPFGSNTEPELLADLGFELSSPAS